MVEENVTTETVTETPEVSEELTLEQMREEALEIEPDATTEEVENEEEEVEETKEEVEEEKKEPKTKIYAKLQAKENEIIQLKRQLNTYDEKIKNTPTPDQLRQFAKENPKEFLETFYGNNLGEVLGNVFATPEEEAFWNDEELDPVSESNQKVHALEKQLADLQARLDGDLQSRKEKTEQEQINSAYREIQGEISIEKTPILSKMTEPNAYMPQGAIGFVFDKAVELYQQTGQQISFSDIVVAVEEMLEEDLGSLTSNPEPTVQEFEVKERVSPTITQQGAIKSSKAMTLEELKEEALRSI